MAEPSRMSRTRALDSARPSSFFLQEGEVIHRQCGRPMLLWQRDLGGEERWFCLTCRGGVYIPREAWFFFLDQPERDEASFALRG